MTRSTSRALRRVLAVAAGLAVGVGASVLDGTGAAADPPDVVCVDQPGSITYVPAPGHQPLTVPACAPPAPPAPPAPAPPTAAPAAPKAQPTRPRAAATSWRALAEQARQRRQQQIAAERQGRGRPRARTVRRPSSSTSVGRKCREIHVEGTDHRGQPRKPLRICR